MKRGPEFFRRKAGRRDANHATIRDGLRALGHFVVDLGGVGDGVPDLCVYQRVYHFDDQDPAREPVWLELKVAKGKLRKSQVSWRTSAEARGIKVATVRTLDEALEAIR